MGDTFLSFLSKKKTLLFLYMCLGVHSFNVVLFYVLGITPLVVVNCLSTAFYAVILLFFRQSSDYHIILTYFEIITFSLLSEILSGCEFFYIFYVVGMVSIVFYLLPPKVRFKHIYQIVGIVFAVTIYFLFLKRVCLFPQYLSLIARCKNQIGFINLCITLVTMFYISNLYIFETNAAREKLTYSSNHDLLTGLFNRRFFEHIMRRNKYENENEFTIAVFDIDDFKKINDTYGHQAGDAVLKVVSGIIENCPDESYVPVRWGGEEFILYMPQTNGNKAFEYLESLVNEVRNTAVEFDGMKIAVTMTVGMCTGSSLIDYEEIIRTADDRLYYGKRNGKNCVVSE